MNLALETYGIDGINEMAGALGLTTLNPAGRKRVGLPHSKSGDGEEAWREPVRMPAMCPPRKPVGKPYEGLPSAFHCGYEGFLENRRPSRSQPIAECFYDERGRLVDQSHPYAGCGGTPDQYLADDLRHVTEDKGGIAEQGWDSFWESRRHDPDRLLGTGR